MSACRPNAPGPLFQVYSILSHSSCSLKKKGTFNIALPCIICTSLADQHIVPRAHHRVIMDAHHLGGPMPQQGTVQCTTTYKCIINIPGGPFKGEKPCSYNLANDLVCIDIIETGSFIP